MDNVVLFPHLGSASVYTRGKMDQFVVDNIAAWAAGKPPLTPVAETPWRSWAKAEPRQDFAGQSVNDYRCLHCIAAMTGPGMTASAAAC